jgi:hypothetical protein
MTVLFVAFERADPTVASPTQAIDDFEIDHYRYLLLSKIGSKVCDVSHSASLSG